MRDIRERLNVGGQDSGCEISGEGGTLAGQNSGCETSGWNVGGGRIPDVRCPGGMGDAACCKEEGATR